MALKNSSILPALIYADIFDYPLTPSELEKYQINQKTTPGAVILKPELTDGYYHLPGRKNLVQLRKKRTLISQIKLDQAKIIAKRLGSIPTILGIFVTGNVAMRNAVEVDDIDLLIITKANHLWLTRLVITIYLESLGVRRHPHQKDPRNRFCLNMYLDETSLLVPKSKRNLYTAHEVVQILPLINKANIYARFLSANRWVNDHLPNFPIPKFDHNLPSKICHPKSTIFEQLAYLLQYRYMKNKITKETISPHSALFHPRDTGKQVLEQYNKVWTKQVLTK